MRRRAKPHPRAIVVGGSLGGLFAATQLRAIGWNVEVFERSPQPLTGQGGIILQPDVELAVRCAGTWCHEPQIVVAREHLRLDPRGRVLRRRPTHQALVSWTMVCDMLRRTLPHARYHQGEQLLDFEQDGEQVIARFASGRIETAALLVAADGAASTVRRQLLPDVEPSYAGYIEVRGVADACSLRPQVAGLLAERLASFESAGAHILVCSIPVDRHAPGRDGQRLGWTWYLKVAAVELDRMLTDGHGPDGHPVLFGRPTPEVEAGLRERAADLLPPPFRGVVAATRRLLVRPVADIAVSRMAFGRAALLGDAAFLARPHLAADAAKAAVNAITLAESLEVIRDDIEQALRFWEPAQLELGRELLAHGPIAAERLGLAKTEPVACAMPDGPPTSRDHDARQARHGEHETHLH